MQAKLRLRIVRQAICVTACLALTAAITACGSSDKSSTSQSAATSGAATSGGGASGAAGVAQAEQLVQKYGTPPTSIGAMTKISKPIPSGKTIAFVDSGTPAVQANIPFLKAAAAAVGWKVVDVPAGTTEAANQTAWATVLRMKPSFVDNNSGFPTSTFAGPCKELASENIPVFDNSVPRSQASGYGGCVKGIVNDERQIAITGQIAADYIVAHSKGKANVLILDVPQIPILAAFTAGMKAELTKLCPSCGQSTLELAVADLGTSAVSTKTIGYIRSHPDTDYVAATYDDLLAGLPTALKAAGENDVTLVGETPQPANIVAISQNGAEKASVIYDQIQANWKMVDMMARYTVGDSITTTETTPDPFFLATSDNVAKWPGTPSAFPWPTVKNYEEQYKTLWGK